MDGKKFIFVNTRARWNVVKIDLCFDFKLSGLLFSIYETIEAKIGYFLV